MAVPLAGTSTQVARSTALQAGLQRAATRYADANGWVVLGVRTDAGVNRVRLTGPAPEPDPQGLAPFLADEGLAGTTVEVELVPATFADVVGG